MKAKKSLGQNFLNNDTIINQIISLFSSTKDDLVIEIGPGRGALTKELIKKDSYLKCIELDKDLEPFLSKFNTEKSEVIYEDILQINLENLIDKNYKKIFVIGNLPYYITSPIIEKLINSKLNIDEMFFMVQKEVADRFSACPGSKEYGYMTVFINHYYDVKTEIFVGKKNFSPAPKVDSAVISLKKKQELFVEDSSEYFDFIKECFKQKRKTLKNNLSNYNFDKINKILNDYSLNQNVRAEELSEEVLLSLFNYLKK